MARGPERNLRQSDERSSGICADEASVALAGAGNADARRVLIKDLLSQRTRRTGAPRPRTKPRIASWTASGTHTCAMRLFPSSYIG